MLPHPITFVPNEADDSHCYQSSVRMAWQGLSGSALSLQDVEQLTEFEPGLQTWPFAGMLAFAKRGYVVRSVEDFRPRDFIDDPAAEIQRQAGDTEITEHVLKTSNVERQRTLVAACLEHPNVVFEARIPDINDLRDVGKRPQTAVMCNVNYKALVGKAGYNGHFVLVDRITDDNFILIQNPGLPPVEDQKVTIARFLSAWKGISDRMANILAISASEENRATK